MKRSKLPSYLLILGVYLAVTGISFGAFKYFMSPSGPLASPVAEDKPGTSVGFGGLITVNPSAPKTEVCPLNGEKFSVDEKNAWSSRRPVIVMLENHLESRPQSGLSSADVVYEAVAEGGITRFMGVFYCRAMGSGEKVAPVRSARIYFVNIAQEYNTPMYVHVGGANCSMDQGTKQCVSDKRSFAIEELAKIGWRYAGGNDIDTTGDGGVPELYRDQNRLGPDVRLATEHTMVGLLSKLWAEAEKRGFTNVMPGGKNWLDGYKPWTFTDGKSAASSQKISFSFWDSQPDFNVEYDYDSATNTYKRSQGGKPQLDLENKQQIAVSNVVVQFAKETGPIDTNHHLLYDVIGSGDGIIFQNGVATPITWKKANATGRTIYSDSKGKEVQFIRGTIWIEIVPKGNKVTY